MIQRHEVYKLRSIFIIGGTDALNNSFCYIFKFGFIIPKIIKK